MAENMKRPLAWVLALALALSMAAPVEAGRFEDGVAAYSKGDFASALRLWRPLAEGGSPEAQVNLGILYKNGQGVAQDYAVAVKWFRHAAKQGSADAENNLGIMYENGWGVPQDYEKALTWFGQAAEKEAPMHRGISDSCMKMAKE